MASLHDKNNPQTIRPILHTDFFLTFSTVLKTDRLPNPLTDISLTTSHPYSVCSTYTTDIIVADRVYQQQLEPFCSSFNCWPFNFLTRQPQQFLFCLGRSFYTYKKLHYFYSSETLRKQQDETPISFHFWISLPNTCDDKAIELQNGLLYIAVNDMPIPFSTSSNSKPS